MADLYRVPNVARLFDYPASGDMIDVVNWPSMPSSTTFSGMPANTLIVVPFMAGYLLDYDTINYISNGTANITWGVYSYEPYTRSGELLAETGEIVVSGGTTTQNTSITQSTIYPGRAYALALNSSAFWNMLVLSGNGAGASRILGGDYSGGNYQNYTHLRTNLTYNATLPPTLPAGLAKSNAIWPPNPLFQSL
jgi:hypothetical protein